jgi:hypothetical protein
MFLDCVNEIGSLDELGKVSTVNVFNSLLEKTINARFGMVLTNYTETITRQGKKNIELMARSAVL